MEVSLKSLVGLGFISEKEIENVSKLLKVPVESPCVWISEEIIQDTFCDFIRTPDPTEQEVEEWYEEYAKIRDLDFKTLGKNVKILDQEKPYKDWQDDFCGRCGTFLSAYRYCGNCKMWEWQND